MTERKSQTKSAGRRSHCSVDILPVELREAAKRMIVGNEWPVDFKGTHNGTPRYSNVVEYCRQKGFIFTKSSVGRFAKQLQTTSTKEIKSDLRPYVMACLADACGDYANLQTDLLEARLHPERMQHVVKQQAELELLAEQKISYIERIIADLKRLK